MTAWSLFLAKYFFFMASKKYPYLSVTQDRDTTTYPWDKTNFRYKLCRATAVARYFRRCGALFALVWHDCVTYVALLRHGCGGIVVR